MHWLQWHHREKAAWALNALRSLSAFQCHYASMPAAPCGQNSSRLLPKYVAYKQGNILFNCFTKYLVCLLFITIHTFTFFCL